MAQTTATRSAIAKAAYARRQADKALGIPSIASMAAAHYAEMQDVGCPVSKAAARRYAVYWIAVRRREAADRAAWAVTCAEMEARRIAAVPVAVAAEPAPAAKPARTTATAMRRAVTAIAKALHADKPWRSKAEAKAEARRRLEGMEGDEATDLVAQANAAYWASLKATAEALSRR